jgi:hypothetical protein
MDRDVALQALSSEFKSQSQWISLNVNHTLPTAMSKAPCSGQKAPLGGAMSQQALQFCKLITKNEILFYFFYVLQNLVIRID